MIILAGVFDFNKGIDNDWLMVKGTIVDTTPSDEILKKNKEVESVCSSCVKNVKVKTFEYISSKYERNDKFGFKAQELQKELPEEFKT